MLREFIGNEEHIYETITALDLRVQKLELAMKGLPATANNDDPENCAAVTRMMCKEELVEALEKSDVVVAQLTQDRKFAEGAIKQFLKRNHPDCPQEFWHWHAT